MLQQKTVFCDNDEENEAVCYCEDCEQNLCADCDDVFHRSKFRQTHKRNVINNPRPDRLEEYDEASEDVASEAESESEEEPVELKDEGRFKVSLVQCMQLQKASHPNETVPLILSVLVKCIVQKGGLTEEGIFRISPDKLELDRKRADFNKGDYTTDDFDSPHIPAALLKLWLRELPAPIIPPEVYNAAVACAEMHDKAKQPTYVLGIWSELDPLRQRVVSYLASLAQQIMHPARTKQNKMSFESLAIIFAPSFLRNPNLSEALAKARHEIEFVRIMLEVLPTTHLKHLYEGAAVPALSPTVLTLSNTTTPAALSQPAPTSRTSSSSSLASSSQPSSSSSSSSSSSASTATFHMPPTTSTEDKQPVARSSQSQPVSVPVAQPPQTSGKENPVVVHAPRSPSRPPLVARTVNTNSMDTIAKFAKPKLQNTERPGPSLQGRHILKVLIVGNASCGKTSIIRRYVTDSFEDEYITTVGADYNTKSIQWADGVDVQLQLWDIAGQDRYARMTRPYFQGAHAAVVVCDVTREASISAVRDWKDDIDVNLTNIPVVLVANKCDLLADGMAGMQVGGRLQELCSEMNFVSWHIISAKRDMNVTEAMSNLVRSALDSKLEEQRRQQRWRLGKERQLQSQEQENILPKDSKKKKSLEEPEFNYSTKDASVHSSGHLKLDAKPPSKKADTCVIS